MTRIAVGAFLHETNTFAPTKATYDDFVHGGGFPSMSLGDGVLKTMRRMNAGIAGFVEAAEAKGWELVPTISCGASPCAHVTKDAFERIVKVMVDGIAAAGPLDGIYLDLHGAMVTEHLDDGEGEILARVRKVIGKELPLVASLDLHANVTTEMVERADALIAYRTYPHVDMADTGRAAANHLALLFKTKQRFAKAFRQLPFLIPISWQCTNDQPTRGIYQKLAALESEAVPTLSFAPGFPAADFADCVSFNPFPVMIATALARRLTIPSSTARRKPATAVAAAGSAKIPASRPVYRMASRISLSLTLIIVPPDSRTANTAFFQLRGTPTAMLSAMVRGSMGRSGSPLRKHSVTGAAPSACTPRMRGVRSISPKIFISRNPFHTPATVQPSPTETATQSAGSQPSCSPISSPTVFLPSTR